MDLEYNYRTSKIIESVLRFVLDDFHLPKTDDYYNYQTNKCVASVFNYVFKEHVKKKLTSEDQINKLADKINHKLNVIERPTFYTNSGQPVRAAGILCYVVDPHTDNKIWLLRENNGYLSDTGGKTDIVDKGPLDTAIRETVEETNGHLFSERHSNEKCHEIISKFLPSQKNKIIYIKSCKYLLFTFQLRYSTFRKPLKRFGKFEKHDNEPHEYRWYHKIPYEKLHPRLYKVRGSIK